MTVNYNFIINYSNLLSFIGAILYCLGRIVNQETNNEFMTSIFSPSISIIINSLIAVSGFISICAWFNISFINKSLPLLT